MAEAPITAPEILQEDLSSFHAKHFSLLSTAHFSEYFLGPVEDSYQEVAEDDGLGYYPDGTKRTLTNEQIAIFRHSEIQSLLRGRRHVEEARESESDAQSSKAGCDEGELEDGELEDELPEAKSKITETPTSPPLQNESRPSKKVRRAEQAKQKGFFKQHVKPDLRKRTWDKVDTGMDSLAYDDEPASTSNVPRQASQRRRISYDDN